MRVLAQARAYARDHPKSLLLRPQYVRFTFGQQVTQSVGIVTVRLLQYDHSDITLKIHVVDLDIPLIIGLDILTYHSLLVNYVENSLEFRNLNSRPLIYKRGHVFEWDVHRIMFTHEELIWLLVNFMHPSVGRLFKLIKRVNP